MAETAKWLESQDKQSNWVNTIKLQEWINKDIDSVRELMWKMSEKDLDKISQSLKFLNPEDLKKVWDIMKVAKVQDWYIAQEWIKKTITMLAEKDDVASLDDLKFV